jgi:hypothetical protein
MPTSHTNKNSLVLAIGTVAMPAIMASLGRVTSINRLDLDTMFTRIEAKAFSGLRSIIRLS